MVLTDWACQVLGFPRIPHILVARARVIIMTDECLCLGKKLEEKGFILFQLNNEISLSSVMIQYDPIRSLEEVEYC